MRYFEILHEANVLNVRDIERFVSQYAATVTDERAKKFFTVNARRWLLHASDFQTRVEDLKGEHPEWARTAFQTGGLVEFRPTQALKDMFEHLANALNEVAEEQPALLDRVARLDPPAVMNLTDEFYERRRATLPVAEEPGVITLISYPDGSRWVELTRPENLQHEGRTMQHCVATYAHRLGSMQVYSFRDARNLSHITVSATGDKLEECKGKQNNVPVEKYVPKVLDLLNLKKFKTVSYDIRKLDIIQHEGQFKRFDLSQLRSIRSDHAEIKPFEEFVYVKPDDGVLTLPPAAEKLRWLDGFFKLWVKHDRDQLVNFLPVWFQLEVLKAAGIRLNERTTELLFEKTESLAEVEETAEAIGMEFRLEPIGGVDLFWLDRKPYAWMTPELKSMEGVPEWVLNKGKQSVLPLKLEGKILRTSSWAPPPVLQAVITLAKRYNLGLDPDAAIAAMAGLSPERAREITAGVRISAGTSISVPRNARALPDGLRLGSTLHLAATEVEVLPDGLTVGRDLILSGSMVQKIGVNTTIKRVLDLRDSLVEELPPGLTVGGKAGSRLDLRKSLITRIPDDTQIVASAATTNHHDPRPAGGKIMVDDPDLVIPEHLRQFVEYKPIKPPKPVIKLSNGAEWVKVNDQIERKYRRFFPKGFFPSFCLIRNGECLGGISMSTEFVGDGQWNPVLRADHWVNPEDKRRYAESQRLLVDRLVSGKKV